MCLCDSEIHKCMHILYTVCVIPTFKNILIDISTMIRTLIELFFIINSLLLPQLILKGSSQAKWTPTITLCLFWPILSCWLTFALVSSVWAKASGPPPAVPPPLTAPADISAWLPLSPLPLFPSSGSQERLMDGPCL